MNTSRGLFTYGWGIGPSYLLAYRKTICWFWWILFYELKYSIEIVFSVYNFKIFNRNCFSVYNFILISTFSFVPIYKFQDVVMVLHQTPLKKKKTFLSYLSKSHGWNKQYFFYNITLHKKVTLGSGSSHIGHTFLMDFSIFWMDSLNSFWTLGLEGDRTKSFQTEPGSIAGLGSL